MSYCASLVFVVEVVAAAAAAAQKLNSTALVFVVVPLRLVAVPIVPNPARLHDSFVAVAAVAVAIVQLPVFVPE